MSFGSVRKRLNSGKYFYFDYKIVEGRLYHIDDAPIAKQLFNWYHFSLTGGISRKDENNLEAEKTTEKFDSEAMRYLSYILIPLLLGGAIYSLLYTPHKSWKSWTIQSLVNAVYAFGFLFMLPQLFVNYRLKVRKSIDKDIRASGRV